MEITQLDNIIKSSKNILIISHINPDGDTLGSMFGLYSAILDNFKKKPDMLLMSPFPLAYSFLPYSEKAKHVSEYDMSREYDLVVNVDVASSDRMFDSAQLFNRAKFTINIDHHITNNGYAKLNFVRPDASSTGEVLYDIIKSLGWKISLNTATCLYTAILTDTGAFRFQNTTRNTMSDIADLIGYGVNPSLIYKYCYETNSKNHVLFQAYCVSKAVFLNNDKIAYIQVYKKDMEKFNVPDDCTEGLAEKLRAILPVEIAFIVKQLAPKVSKVSMRSEIVDVSAICAKLGGGGHKLAAGVLLKSGIKDATDKILNEINDTIKL